MLLEFEDRIPLDDEIGSVKPDVDVDAKGCSGARDARLRDAFVARDSSFSFGEDRDWESGTDSGNALPGDTCGLKGGF